MRELAHGARQSGRTTTLLLTMLEEMEMHDNPVYLVVSTYGVGRLCMDYLRKINCDVSRVRIVDINSLHILRGSCPMDVYIEHTAYEQSTWNQLQSLYKLEDAKDNYVFG